MTYREFALEHAAVIVADAMMYSPNSVEAALKILIECNDEMPSKVAS